MKKLGLLLCLSFAFSTTVLAQGDAEAGKAKSLTCAACHGADGNSAIEMNPKLAGQHANYLAKQLAEFKLAYETGGKEGRNNPIMGAQAAGLSEQDMQDLAAYFSSQEQSAGSTPEDVIEKGQKLYRGGDVDRGVTACIACHGPRGNGMGLAGFPDISGQHTGYLKSQLEMFKSGDRANDLNGMMRDIAKKLTDEDIEVLSKYLGGLH
ncbi:c-type cytochrome [Aliiglaciecola sp. LCG003]|uniref:c-type cytochrome n=1 Tax=Aliiglaciecola sp. LCG003 TaxID=3053655 RepID=UPI0025729626|nr:c-type cytochrome [Aliiglaciecola sp. LCG003]WJG09469.1 c-type cytochrome [Aliiglaciecola sp. LCG003]